MIPNGSAIHKKPCRPFFGNVVEICVVAPDHRRVMAGLVQLGVGGVRVRARKYQQQDLQRVIAQSLLRALGHPITCEIIQRPNIFSDFPFCPSPPLRASFLSLCEIRVESLFGGCLIPHPPFWQGHRERDYFLVKFFFFLAFSVHRGFAPGSL